MARFALFIFKRDIPGMHPAAGFPSAEQELWRGALGQNLWSFVMDQENLLAPFDWHVYLGCGLFTADNQRVGVIKELRTDPRTGALFLIVQDDHPSGIPLCIPATTIGIATRFRLMLDIIGRHVPVSEWRENDCGDLLQA